MASILKQTIPLLLGNRWPGCRSEVFEVFFNKSLLLVSFHSTLATFYRHWFLKWICSPINISREKTNLHCQPKNWGSPTPFLSDFGSPPLIPILIVCSENIGAIPATDPRNSKNYVGFQSVRGGGAWMKTPPNAHFSLARCRRGGYEDVRKNEDMRMSGKIPLMSPNDDKW